MKYKCLSAIRVAIFLAILIGLGILLEIQLNKRNSSYEDVLDSGWDITIDGEKYENCTISQFHFPEMKKGTKVVLSYTFPEEEANDEQTSIRMLVRYSYIHAYFDDMPLYTKNLKYYNDDKLLGNGYVWIHLPANYPGGTLKIVLFTGENNSFTSLDEFSLVRTDTAYSWLIDRNIVTAIITCFTFLLGILGILYCLIMGNRDKNTKMALYISLFSISISLWIACNSRMMQVISEDFHINGTLEYYGMYLAADSLILYVSEFVREKKVKKIFKGIALGFVGLEVLLIILNNTNILHFPKTSHIFQGFAGIAIIFMIYMLVNAGKKNHKVAERVLLLGVILFISSALMELGRYQYNKQAVPAYQLHQSVVPIGALLFVLAMLFSLLVLMLERVAENMERKTLYDMAYQDALTGLKNRAWCEDVMEQFDKNHERYTILNMDLNDFKQVNDTYGHLAGDEVLIQFGEVLQKSFEEGDCVGRMGGDEFVVITNEVRPDQINHKLGKLIGNIDKHNETAPEEYQLSVSIGFASNTGEEDVPAWKIYEMADRNMYERKQRRKEGK